MNEVKVDKILPQVSYFTLSVDPGKYTFTPKMLGIYKTTEGTVEANAGQVYFVQLKMALGHISFGLMNKDEAMASMATCYQLDPIYSIDSRVTIFTCAKGSNY